MKGTNVANITGDGAARPTVLQGEAEAPAKPKPFSNCRPRDQWKPRSKWRKPPKGRRIEGVCVGVDKAGENLYKLFRFEMRPDGVHVRPKHGRKASEKVWKWAALANGANPVGQMEMFQPKGEK